jgi:hypothetical protein
MVAHHREAEHLDAELAGEEFQPYESTRGDARRIGRSRYPDRTDTPAARSD